MLLLSFFGLKSLYEPWDSFSNEEAIMKYRLFLVAVLVGMTGIPLQTQKYTARSATLSVASPPLPAATFVASTEKPFDQLMDEAMNVMHRDMHNAEYTGEADHDFVTMMIPHHQGAIDMAKALLLYGKDPQMRRLAQEIITDQQSEIQLMQLWLKQHSISSQTQTQKPGLDARKNWR
jgi:hypothetical protein